VEIDETGQIVEMLVRRYGFDDRTTESVLRPVVLATLEEHVAVPLANLLGGPNGFANVTDLLDANEGRIEATDPFSPGSPLGAPLVVVDEAYIYLRRLARAECRVAAAIHASMTLVHEPLGALTEADINDALDEIIRDLDRQGMNSPELGLVVRNMVRFPVSFVTGGPGTGKTWIVAQALRVIDLALSRHHTQGASPSVGLAAPTGKAARRVSDSVTRALAGQELVSLVRDVSTEGSLHQLLGLRPDNSSRPQPLRHDLVIVDEVSMADLTILDALVRASQGRETGPSHIVLVGDPYQLASVSVGAVLSDVVSTEARTDLLVTRLTKQHRFVVDPASTGDGTVMDLAQAVIGQEAEQSISLLRGGGSSLALCESGSDPSVTMLVLSHARAQVAAASAGDAASALNSLSALAVLAANLNGPSSVEWWNSFVTTALDDEVTWVGDFYIGQPVLVTRNQPSLKVSNGDVGVVMPGDTPSVVFDHDRRLPLSSVGYLTSAWAMTIHKSQGSEYEHVIVSLPRVDSPLLTRELFYTGITRAKKRVTVIASEDAIGTAVATTIERVSGLTARLRAWAEAASVEDL
jgi:exodeoxyribonuclease V alpha subunit